MTKNNMYEMLHNIQRNFVAEFEWEANTQLPVLEKHEYCYGIDVRLYEQFAITMLDIKKLITAANITWNTNTFKGRWVCIAIFHNGNDTIISII